MKGAVFITGGSRGIGAAAVRLFRQAGHPVGFIYEKSDEAARTLAEDSGALAFKADVSVKAQLDAVIAEAQRRLGPIEVLVNNAGISAFSMFQDISEADWRRMLDVNLTGAFFAAQGVAPGMVTMKRGVILNVSSVWGLTGASCEVHYATSKAALIGFTKALAKELGPSGIRVNCVAPGVIQTDMNRTLGEADIDALIEQTPLGRLGTPDEVARTLVFLASDGAGFITGQVISPNGGFVI